MLTKVEMEFYNTMMHNMKKQTELYNEIVKELETLNQNLIDSK